jgi:hypothetical protein
MLDLVNVALRTLMCLAFLVWVVRPMLFALSRREPNQGEIEDIVDSAVHSAFKSLGVKNPPPRLPTVMLPQEPVLDEQPVSAEAETDTAVPEEPPEVMPEPEERAATETPEAGAAHEAAETPEAEPDPEEALRQMRERIKQEQKKAAKPTIPAELLQDANSYEDKLVVVRMMVEQEQSRVASVLKRMIKIDG